jgi:hypothetical protein
MMTADSPRQRDRRRRALALLVAAPSIVIALGLTAIEGWRFHRPGSRLFTAPFVYSLADAIERDDVRRAHQFIREGADPNGLIAVRHTDLTKGRWVLVSPLLWAVATQSRLSAMMLLGFGARMERAADRRATCLAEELGNEDLVRFLRLYGGESRSEPCPARALGNSPLLSALGEAE